MHGHTVLHISPTSLRIAVVNTFKVVKIKHFSIQNDSWNSNPSGTEGLNEGFKPVGREYVMRPATVFEKLCVKYKRLHNDLDPSVYQLLISLNVRIWSQSKIILDVSGLNCPTFWLWQKKSLEPTQNNFGRFWVKLPNILAVAEKKFGANPK